MTNTTISTVTLDQVLDIRQAVLWPDQPRDFSRVEGDDTALHLGAHMTDHPENLLCVASLYATATGARLRKFATLPDFQGRGIGSQMLAKLITHAARDHDRMWMGARLTAVPLYRRFGFGEFGPRFEKGGMAYCYLERDLG